MWSSQASSFSPGADAGKLAEFLKGLSDVRCVMLVGHEPQLGALVASLLGREGNAIPLKKGACVALELDLKKSDKPADFLWYLVPGSKLKTSFKKAFPQ